MCINPLNDFNNPTEETLLLSPVLQMKIQKLREVWKLMQSHTAQKWWSRALNPDSLLPSPCSSRLIECRSLLCPGPSCPNTAQGHLPAS